MTENPCVLGSIPRRGKFFVFPPGHLCHICICNPKGRKVDSKDVANFAYELTLVSVLCPLYILKALYPWFFPLRKLDI